MKLSLPLPPSINATYKTGRGVFYKSDKAKVWENTAGHILLPLRPKNPLEGQLCVNITMFLKRDRDIDGSLKLLFDLLQKMGFCINDSQIYDLRVKKLKDKDNPHIEVEIKLL